MFSIEMKVNGMLIAHIYGRNITHIKARKGDYLYTYELYDADKGTVEKGEVVHTRSKGILALVNKILNKEIK